MAQYFIFNNFILVIQGKKSLKNTAQVEWIIKKAKGRNQNSKNIDLLYRKCQHLKCNQTCSFVAKVFISARSRQQKVFIFFFFFPIPHLQNHRRVNFSIETLSRKSFKEKKVILRFNAAKCKVEYKSDKNVFHLIWLFSYWNI